LVISLSALTQNKVMMFDNDCLFLYLENHWLLFNFVAAQLRLTGLRSLSSPLVLFPDQLWEELKQTHIRAGFRSTTNHLLFSFNH